MNTPVASADVDETQLKPSTMRGTELRYGYLIAAELIFVAVMNFALRHGKGAPVHPQTGLSIIGLVAAVAVLAVLRTRSRFIVPFAAVIAAFFVTLPRGPASLQSFHVVAIIFPLIYALLLTQRQRKAAMAQARAGGNAGTSPRRTGRTGRTVRTGRSRKSPAGSSKADKAEVATGPGASRRYTPPKQKRTRR